MSHFLFYIYKAIRKVLFCLFLLKGLIRVLFLDLNETSIIQNVFLQQV